MKSKKMNLAKLKVSSFVTGEKEKMETVKGGAYSAVCTEFGSGCPTGALGCPTGVWRCPGG